MIRLFNAFQMVVCFAAAPFVVAWLYTEPFPYSTAAMWTAGVVYLASFAMMTGIVHESMER